MEKLDEGLGYGRCSNEEKEREQRKVINGEARNEWGNGGIGRKKQNFASACDRSVKIDHRTGVLFERLWPIDQNHWHKIFLTDFRSKYLFFGHKFAGLLQRFRVGQNFYNPVKKWSKFVTGCFLVKIFGQNLGFIL